MKQTTLRFARRKSNSEQDANLLSRKRKIEAKSPLIGKKKSAASFPSPQHFSPLPSSSVHHSKSKSKSHNERILASPEFGGLDDAHTPVVNRRKNNYNDMDDDKDVGMSSIFDEYNTGAEKELFVPASPEHDFSSFSANNTDNNSTNDDDDLESDPLLAHGAKSFSMPNGRRLSTGLKASSINMKVYRDPIHEDVEIHPACLEIIDTRQFQRLRGLLQLGACSYVFSGATHNRFQHSIGVMHLGGEFCRLLRKHQPLLNITDKDILCVELAGLCHDLGHGPFSHVFDGVFIPRMIPGCQWKHEQASVDMLQYLMEENEITLEKYGLTSTDITFITEMIIGVPNEERKGRGREKEFLYDIINNTRSGLDVDKLDYYQRDTQLCGVFASGCDYSRVRKLARVAQCDGELHIAYPEKAVNNIVSFFRTRFELHTQVYTHRVVKAIEYMIVDALVAAEPFYRIQGSGGKQLKLSECIGDMEAYSWLKDSLLDEIARSADPNLAPARAIIDRIYKRKLYQSLGSITIDQHDCEEDHCPEYCGKDNDELKQAIVNSQPTSYSASQGSGIDEMLGSLEVGDLIINRMKLHWGMKHENPVEKVRFFRKFDSNLESATVVNMEEKMADKVPRQFMNLKLRVFCRDPKKLPLARLAFERWCEHNGCSSPFPSSQDY